MVAIKVISLEGTGARYLRGVKRIVNEIRTLKQVNSDYVAKYYGGYLKRDTVWLVLELIDGVDALDFTSLEECLSTEHIARICRGILEALVEMHHLNIIHHDVKLENVMVSRLGQVKIIDMGLSLNGGATVPGFSGTLSYAAPEMLNEEAYDSSVDIWALGVCLFSLEERYKPYKGATIDDMRREYSKQGELDVEEKLFYADSDLADFISRCLKFKRQERATADELLDHPFVRSAADSEEMAMMVKRTILLNNSHSLCIDTA